MIHIFSNVFRTVEVTIEAKIKIEKPKISKLAKSFSVEEGGDLVMTASIPGIPVLALHCKYNYIYLLLY